MRPPISGCFCESTERESDHSLFANVLRPSPSFLPPAKSALKLLGANTLLSCASRTLGVKRVISDSRGWMHALPFGFSANMTTTSMGAVGS